MRPVFVAAFLLISSAMQAAQAGVVVGGTRLVYKGAAKDASIGLENTDKDAFLVQSWVEDEKGGDAQSVFLVTPPLFKMLPESASLLRVIKTANLPEDRESLFWLNVRSIPSIKDRADANQLTLSVQARMKLIYRPQALLGQTVDQASEGLKWQCAGSSLSVSNPTQYYMNFASVKVNGKGVDTPGFVGPGASKSFAGAVSGSDCAVSWQVINDYGSAGQVRSTAAAR